MSRAERVAYYAALDARLRALFESLGVRLPERDSGYAREFLDAGEYGLALEQIPDGLSEDEIPISDAERTELLDLAVVMGSERPTGALE